MEFEIKVPEAGFSITEGKVVAWHKKSGDRIAGGETVVSVETDKITVEVPAEGSGILKEIRVREGEIAPVGGVLGIIAEEGPAAAERAQTRKPIAGISSPEPEPKTAPGSAVPSAAGGFSKKVRMSPLAKALARKKGMDMAVLLKSVRMGSGPEGRIVKEDVLRFAEKSAGVSPAAVGPVPPPVQAGEKIKKTPAGAAKVPFTGWRKVVAERMLAASRSVPHYTMSVEVDVTELAAFIASARERIEKPRLTYLPFVMKACAAGMDAVPEVNAYVYDDGYVLLDAVNIGFAVDLGEKLLVPVVGNVRGKSIIGIAEELAVLTEKARADKLEKSDIEGGTFTVTNVGVYGIHSGTSIILQPQSSILYVGAVREVPAVVEGRIEVRKRMMVGGTFDHRLVNGGPGARFLKEVKNHLENLASFVLNLR